LVVAASGAVTNIVCTFDPVFRLIEEAVPFHELPFNVKVEVVCAVDAEILTDA
jgi:hypothetical protein